MAEATGSFDWWLEDIVYEIYKMERLTYYLKLRQEDFTSIWFEWTIYIAPRRADFIWCILYVFNSSKHIPPSSMYIIIFMVPDRPFMHFSCYQKLQVIKRQLSVFFICLYVCFLFVFETHDKWWIPFCNALDTNKKVSPHLI